MFAKYLDNVSDARDISGFSRFMSGGIGGITSQLGTCAHISPPTAIYPIETLKTRLMSSQTAASPLRGFALLADTARSMYTQGGFRAYYRGLGAGLVGVFPYSAIDMSTFEGIKLFYLKYTHKEDPGVIPLLMFGSISGSVGASTVYPLNLIRTRLQASGTPAHPRIYTSFFDAAVQTYRNEGPLGFYRGLIPSLAKVVPAVSISYVVYEQVRAAWRRTHTYPAVQTLPACAINSLRPRAAHARAPRHSPRPHLRHACSRPSAPVFFSRTRARTRARVASRPTPHTRPGRCGTACAVHTHAPPRTLASRGG